MEFTKSEPENEYKWEMVDAIDGQAPRKQMIPFQPWEFTWCRSETGRVWINYCSEDSEYEELWNGSPLMIDSN